ncbi:MAG TPA: amino acid adenylation domain-containing protein [Actinospica sp.]|nr:amino acid adenylation domain-containing protein [Actinospica sp.]
MSDQPKPFRSLHSGFQQFEKSRPELVALSVGGTQYTYGEAGRTARRWAGALTEAVGGRPARVGVLASRNQTSYLGVLAALYAGAAFVPLNPRFPASRTRSMIEQAELDAVIVDEANLGELPALLAGLPHAPVVLAPESDLPDAAPLRELPEIAAEDTAYLLFTSGSTGVPKGVPITHGNVRAFLDANQDRYGFTEADRFSQTFEQTFDLSVFDLFMAWDNGARVCSMQAIELLSPYGFLERNGVTVWFSVPSAAAVLLKRGSLLPGRMPTLRWSLFCGEALPRSVAEAWQQAAPNSTLENLYGPTELTIACATYRWDPRTSPDECENDLVPIGTLYPGLSRLLVDERLEPVPAGAAGELCVAGPQCFPGYWQAPELTERKCFERDGLVYYRTGDLVRPLEGGDDLVFLGRNDQQVKVGGYRIELGEIEAALRRAGGVEAACVVHPRHEEIVAFVSGGETQRMLDRLAEHLPSYMVPKSVLVLDDLPRNGSGKIDRNALRQSLSAHVEGAQLVQG